MSASALPKPERINQIWLEEAMDLADLRGTVGMRS